MRLLVKNMVCPRCISAVKSILVSEGFTVKSVTLGEVETEESLSDEERQCLAEKLQEIGFELLDDPRSHHLNKDYSTLSKLFSEVKGITIERFAIIHRIEYVKELLCYSQLSTSEIAYRLGYSSPAYLSSQFKQVTGMTPKEFRELGHHERISLDAL